MTCQQKGTDSISIAFTTFSSNIKGPIKVPVKLAVTAAVEVLSDLACPRCCCLCFNLTADTSDKDPLLNLPACPPVCLNSRYPIYAFLSVANSVIFFIWLTLLAVFLFPHLHLTPIVSSPFDHPNLQHCSLLNAINLPITQSHSSVVQQELANSAQN